MAESTTQTLTLTEFLLARIAEEEAVVGDMPDWHCTDSARGEGWGSRGDCRICGAYMFDGTENVTEEAYGEHLDEVHRRPRVLARCRADRAIVDLHPTRTAYWWGGEAEVEVCDTCSTGPYAQDEDVEAPCPTLRALASVYADHPDYQPEWAL